MLQVRFVNLLIVERRKVAEREGGIELLILDIIRKDTPDYGARKEVFTNILF